MPVGADEPLRVPVGPDGALRMLGDIILLFSSVNSSGKTYLNCGQDHFQDRDAGLYKTEKEESSSSLCSSRSPSCL